jgi:hypothetical protein
VSEPASPGGTWTITGKDFDPLPVGIFFYSAFFTSAWLWLYIPAVFLSRVLLRMNNGVGFLLRVTDVEKQPFRSMGFVSVGWRFGRTPDPQRSVPTRTLLDRSQS